MTDSVLSFGGGVNSVALAILLVNEGWRGHVVFSDTGTEWPDTYCYMEMFEREWLKPRELEIVRLGVEFRGSTRTKALIEHCEERRVIPVQHPRWCTRDYKVRPMQRWCKAHGLSNDQSILGIAADESWRMPLARRPLVDRGIDRDGCVRIIKGAGLSVPHKSGCYICPFQRNDQWRELWTRYPELFERAARLERMPRNKTEGWVGRGYVLAADGHTTLAQRRLAYESQMQLFDDEELMEYRPCLCSL